MGRPSEALQTLASFAKGNFLKKHGTEPESTGENKTLVRSVRQILVATVHTKSGITAKCHKYYQITVPGFSKSKLVYFYTRGIIIIILTDIAY
jgi:hypothetical protein